MTGVAKSKRVLRGGAIAAIGAGAVICALGPGAPYLVALLADGARVGQMGRVSISGVSGAWLGDLHFSQIAIADSKGSWAQAEEVDVRWRPWRLAVGQVDVAAVTAQSLNLLRAPPMNLSPSRAPRLRLNMDRIRCARVTLGAAPDLRGQSFDVTGALVLDRGVWRRALLDVKSEHGGTDYLAMHWAQGVFTLEASGARGGPLDQKLNLGGETRAAFRFEQGVGAGQWLVAADPLLTIDSVKDGETVRIKARAQPRVVARWRALAPEVTDAFEGNVEIDPRNIRAQVTGSGVFLRAEAARDSAGRMAETINIEATAQSLRALRPKVPIGATSFVGTIKNWRTIAGRVQMRDVMGLAVAAEGPGRLELKGASRRVEIDLALRAEAGASPRLRQELNAGKVSAKVEQSGDAALRILALNVKTKTLAANGRSENGGVRGDWVASDVSAWLSGVSGAAKGEWRFAPQRPGSPSKVALEGRTMRLRAGKTVSPLLDESMAVSLAATFQRGALEFEQIKLAGRRLRIGARGRLENGAFDLALEASARGPFPIGAGVVEGPIDAHGRLRGPIGRYMLNLETSWPAMDVAGARVRNVHARWSLDSQGGDRVGRVDAAGEVFGAPITLEGPLRIDGADFASNQITAVWRGIELTGPVRFDRAGLNLDLAVAGDMRTVSPQARGAVTGYVRMAPDAGRTRLEAELTLGKGKWSDLAVTSATVKVDGPPAALRVQTSMKARSGRLPFNVQGEGAIANAVVTINAHGEAAGKAFLTRGPLTASFRAGRTQFAGDIGIGDGAVSARLAHAEAGFDFTAQLNRAPLEIMAPWTGIELAGAATGQLNLKRTDNIVAGGVELDVAQAQLSSRAGDPIDARINAKLEREEITGELRAISRDGLQASLNLNAPLRVRPVPLRVALNGDRVGMLSWSVAGKAESVWPLIGARDQDLGGQINATGTATFAPGRLQGSGSLVLSGGRFEDKDSGFRLRDIETEVVFENSGAELLRFGARDDEGGGVRATGAATSLRSGKVVLELTRLRVLNRPEAKVRASGPLTLAWTPGAAKVTGALNIDEATLSPGGRARATFAEIDVIEINRGDEDTAPAPPLVSRTLAGVLFDMSVRAPGRVFVRGRGLESEWSVDAAVRGDAAAPSLNGEALLVRGDYRLAGRVFDLESGIVRLNGPLSQARLDVVAVRNEADLEARIALSGRLSDPKASLSSSPTLPEDEILPQILFGRSGASLSPLEAAQAAASLAELTGRSAFNVAGIARDLVGLDRLDVRSGGDGLRIAGGKYLTRDVYLEVARNGLGATESQVEWRVQPRFIVISSFAPDGDRRVSLRWRREY